MAGTRYEFSAELWRCAPGWLLRLGAVTDFEVMGARASCFRAVGRSRTQRPAGVHRSRPSGP